MIEPIEHRFDDPATLAEHFSQVVAENLSAAIADRGTALIAVSGGTTPERFMTTLSSHDLDWSRVTITLADDRWLPPTHHRSNEFLVRRTLLRNNAAYATFVPLYTGTADPVSGWHDAEANIDRLPLPFDVMILGLGNDGHCASLFPDGDRFAQATDPAQKDRTMPMLARSVDEPRITLTLPTIIATRNLYLHIEGKDKHDVLDRVERGEGVFASSPLRSIMQHAVVPLNVYWCA
jgi:6-phosphogluconolactonase